MAMSTWILEVGNSRAKWAQFSAEASPKTTRSRASACPLEGTLPDSARGWVEDIAAGDHVVVTGSGNLGPWIEAFRPTRVFRPGDDIPLHTDVTEPGKLGLDRVANAWAVAWAAWQGLTRPKLGWWWMQARA